MKPQRILREAQTKPAENSQPPSVSAWQKLTRRVKHMADGDGQFQNIPFRVFTWLIGLTVGAVFAFAVVYTKVDEMNTRLIMHDAQQARERDEDNKRNNEERQRLENKINEQQAYINQFRVEVARSSKGR